MNGFEESAELQENAVLVRSESDASECIKVKSISYMVEPCHISDSL